MLDKNHVKSLNQRPHTHPFMTVLVLFVLAEKLRLFIILFLQRKTTLQRPQVDASVAQGQLVAEGVVVFEDVYALVDQVYLSQDANCSGALLVNLAS